MKRIVVILLAIMLALIGCSGVKGDIVADATTGNKTVSDKSKLGVLVNSIYDDAGYFRDGVCPVNIHGKWGVIDKQGELIVKPQWDYMSLCSQDGYLMVGNYIKEVDGGYIVECGFIDIKGNVVVPLQKSFIEVAIAYIVDAKYIGNDTFVINTYEHGLVYYDNKGNEIQSVKNKYQPKLEYVQIKEKNNGEDRYGIADKNGRVIIKPQYSMAFSMGNGFFVINEGGLVRESVQGGTWKIINERNETIKDLGEDGYYYVNDEPGHGWGESFPLHTPAGTIIVGAVKKEDLEAQNLLDTYLNINKVEFETIVASSTLRSQDNYDYGPQNAYDNNNFTAWVEGAPGNGEGQWIKFSRNTDSIIKTIIISNGYCKDSSIFKKNGRVKELKLEFSDGTAQLVSLPDNMYEYTVVNLPQGVKTSFVKCTIMSVYVGEKYNDTCINEIAFFDDSLENRVHSNNTSNLKTGPNEDAKMYAEYYKILKDRIDQYGILPTYEYDGTNSTVALLNASGVAYAFLLDFDGNSREELFICYNSTEGKRSKYIDASSPCVYEIWGHNGSSYLIAKEWATVFGGGSSLRGGLDVYKVDGDYYVVNSQSEKNVDELGIAWDLHYTYGHVINGKWVKRELTEKIGGSGEESSKAPWIDVTPIISFDELTYTDHDKARLLSFLEKLKKT